MKLALIMLGDVGTSDCWRGEISDILQTTSQLSVTDSTLLRSTNITSDKLFLNVKSIPRHERECRIVESPRPKVYECN